MSCVSFPCVLCVPSLCLVCPFTVTSLCLVCPFTVPHVCLPSLCLVFCIHCVSCVCLFTVSFVCVPSLCLLCMSLHCVLCVFLHCVVHVSDCITLQVEREKAVIIQGPRGSGKTSIVKGIAEYFTYLLWCSKPLTPPHHSHVY